MTTSAEAALNSALLALNAGQWEEAARHSGVVLSQFPQHPLALYALGLARQKQDRHEEAAELIAASAERAPSLPGIHNYLGISLARLNRYDESIDAFRSALEADANSPEIHCNLGNALVESGLANQALACFEAALQLSPASASIHYNHGRAWLKLGDFEKALEQFERAIALEPDEAEFHLMRGLAFYRLDQRQKALLAFQKSAALDSHQPYALGWIVLTKRELCDWTGLSAAENNFLSELRAGRATIDPFGLLGVSPEPSDHQINSRLYTRSQIRALPKPLFKARPHQSERIRIGYFSPDFRSHVMGRLTVELFEAHDRDRFEIHGISYGVDDGSELRRRIFASFDRATDIREFGDVKAAQAMADLGLDMVVDLAGYIRLSRSNILSWRPAPVQAQYMGYPATMGAAFIDYTFVDRNLVPPGQERFFDEELVYLPDCYMVSDSKRDISETRTRSAYRLPGNAFVFCAFGQPYKITPAMFDIWMRLVDQVPHSVLWLIDYDKAASENLRREAGQRGISPERLVFAHAMPYPDYLAAFRAADLFLDAVPYNGHSTVNDALFAGLPVVTTSTAAFAGRVARSQLTALGLPELIAADLADYEQLVLKIAGDRARLAAIRDKLAIVRVQSPLFDTPRFTRHIEWAYEHMVQRHRSGQSPASFAVPGLNA